MKLTGRQIKILKALRDKPHARLIRSKFAPLVTFVDGSGVATDLRRSTSDHLLLDGLVKNIGSIQYKSYTISPAGLRALADKDSECEEESEISDEDCYAALADCDESITMPPKRKRPVTLKVRYRRKGTPSEHEEEK